MFNPFLDFFITLLTIFTGFTVFLLVRPISFISKFFEIEPFHSDDVEVNKFRIILLVFPVMHLLSALFIEVS